MAGGEGEVFTRFGGEHGHYWVKEEKTFHVGSMRDWRGSEESQQVDALGRQILSSNEEEVSGPFSAL